MARYLIPTDFSKVSANAIQYALDATPDEDILDIVHVSTGIVNLTEAPIIQNLEQTEDAVRLRLEQYFTDELKGSSLPDRCNVIATTGEIVNSIVKQSKKESYEQIIMGTRDKYDLLDRWLGTISLGVVKRSDLNVLLVPPKAKFAKISDAVVAGDIHLTQEKNLESITEWNQSHASTVHFIHVTDDSQKTYLDTADNIVKNYYEAREVSFSYDITKVEGPNVAEALMDAGAESNSQVIIILPEKQTFFESLFLGSVSKDLILKSNIPLLFIKS